MKILFVPDYAIENALRGYKSQGRDIHTLEHKLAAMEKFLGVEFKKVYEEKYEKVKKS